MTLRWLLDNVKGADYIVIETKEKELNPFTGEVESEHKVCVTYSCDKTEQYEQYLDKEIENVYLDSDYAYDVTEVGFWVRLNDK
jgi:hypothetical protein